MLFSFVERSRTTDHDTPRMQAVVVLSASKECVLELDNPPIVYPDEPECQEADDIRHLYGMA